jgi:hypothetical protein
MSVGLEMDWDLPTGEGMVNFMRSRMMKIIGMMRRIWKMKSPDILRIITLNFSITEKTFV